MRSPGDGKLYIKIFEELRNYIVENNLRPGDYLPTEQTLYSRFGVSRNVLREAIKSMELMGMVESCAGRGTIIKEFNLDFIFQNLMFFSTKEDKENTAEDLLSIRRNLELSYCPQIFVGATSEDIDRLKLCVKRISSCGDNFDSFCELNTAFHMALMRPVGNKLLLSLVGSAWSMRPGTQADARFIRLSDTIASYMSIVSALEDRHYEHFVEAMQKADFSAN